MSKSNLVTISMPEDVKEMALEDSKTIFGSKGNISGYICYLVREANKKK